MAAEVEQKLAEEFPACEILIHVDPEGQIDHPGNSLVETDETPQNLRTSL